KHRAGPASESGICGADKGAQDWARGAGQTEGLCCNCLSWKHSGSLGKALEIVGLVLHFLCKICSSTHNVQFTI
ncbi:unnamed protein product, partial [Bubo scandiacus]